MMLVKRMTRRVETSILHHQRYVKMTFLGGRVRHQLHLQLEEEQSARRHVATRRSELAAQVALKVQRTVANRRLLVAISSLHRRFHFQRRIGRLQVPGTHAQVARLGK